MKLSALIKELNHVLETCGDLETFVQETHEIVGGVDIGICAHDAIWIMPEDYEDENGVSETVCNIRTWPYLVLHIC